MKKTNLTPEQEKRREVNAEKRRQKQRETRAKGEDVKPEGFSPELEYFAIKMPWVNL